MKLACGCVSRIVELCSDHKELLGDQSVLPVVAGSPTKRGGPARGARKVAWGELEQVRLLELHDEHGVDYLAIAKALTKDGYPTRTVSAVATRLSALRVSHKAGVLQAARAHTSNNGAVDG